MRETPGRLLRLLALLQLPRDWSGTELAERLGVTTRTVRRDIDRLRELGYPVRAAMGPIGGYRLGAGAELPPCCWTTRKRSQSRSACAWRGRRRRSGR